MKNDKIWFFRMSPLKCTVKVRAKKNLKAPSLKDIKSCTVHEFAELAVRTTLCMFSALNFLTQVHVFAWPTVLGRC